MKRRIPMAIAVLVGFFTVLGYFMGPYVPGFQVHLLFIRWAALLAAVAVFMGILNLLGIHLRRVIGQKREWFFSLVLIFSALTVVIIAAVEKKGPSGPMVAWAFHSVLSPLEAAVASLLVFFLVAAAFRAMRKRPTLPTFIFVATIILVLLGTVPLPGGALAGVRNWLVRVFATAGARGMLLGVALGTLASGIRVLVGIDRPYSEREP